MSVDTLELQPMAEPVNTATRRQPGDSWKRPEAVLPEPLPFRFTGTGAEYFRIWVVNLLLTILSVGVYSAWAKVRRLQYFYRNTSVDGAIFDYHGNPRSILKGRILVFVLLAVFKIADEVSDLAGAIVALVLAVLLPWLLARSFRFRLINSRYRGLRFRFAGTAGAAYRMLSLIPILAGLTAFFIWNVAITPREMLGMGTLLVGGLLLLMILGTVPLAHFLLKRFQHDNAYFGNSPFFFHAEKLGFVKVYAQSIGFLLLGSVSAGVFGMITKKLFTALQATMFGWLFALFYGVVSAYAFYLFVRPFLESRIQNLVWNGTELAGHHFVSTASARKLLWLHASNLAFITFSLGLYKPFAAIRLMKYKVESLTLVPDGSLEEFLCDHVGDNADAIGQEAGDLFDMEIGL
jgi:uncharacterized membrane protein YjgN (DUF898 family)